MIVIFGNDMVTFYKVLDNHIIHIKYNDTYYIICNNLSIHASYDDLDEINISKFNFGDSICNLEEDQIYNLLNYDKFKKTMRDVENTLYFK